MGDLARRQPLLILLLLLISSLFLYHSSVLRYYHLWLTDDYSHGFLLLAVCIYIFYERWREQISSPVLSPDLKFGLPIIGMSMIWAAASLTFIEKIELISFLLILPLLFIALVGWQKAKPFLFSFLLLLLAAPVVEMFNNIFRLATAILSGFALEITGLTVFIDGYLLQLPVGTFEVDTGCSGIRVVTVGLILALMYTYMNKLNLRLAIIVIGLGFGLSFLSNIIRVYMIVVAGHLTKMQHPWIEDHANLGWFVFGVMMVIYFLLLHRYIPTSQKSVENQIPETVPENRMQSSASVNVGRNNILSIIVIMLAVGSGPALTRYLEQQTKNLVSNPLVLPEKLGTLTKITNVTSDWSPQYKFGKGDHSEKAEYQDGKQKLTLFIRQFLKQSPENEAINVNNRVYTRGVWSEVSSHLLKVYNDRVLPYPVEETVISKGSSRQMLVWRWYETNGGKTGDSRVAKLLNLWGTLKAKPAIIVYIMAVDIEDNLQHSRGLMAKALSAHENISTKVIE